jgi:hypothetical protein
MHSAARDAAVTAAATAAALACARVRKRVRSRARAEGPIAVRAAPHLLLVEEGVLRLERARLDGEHCSLPINGDTSEGEGRGGGREK